MIEDNVRGEESPDGEDAVIASENPDGSTDSSAESRQRLALVLESSGFPEGSVEAELLARLLEGNVQNKFQLVREIGRSTRASYAEVADAAGRVNKYLARHGKRVVFGSNKASDKPRIQDLSDQELKYTRLERELESVGNLPELTARLRQYLSEAAKVPDQFMDDPNYKRILNETAMLYTLFAIIRRAWSLLEIDVEGGTRSARKAMFENWLTGAMLVCEKASQSTDFDEEKLQTGVFRELAAEMALERLVHKLPRYSVRRALPNKDVRSGYDFTVVDENSRPVLRLQVKGANQQAMLRFVYEADDPMLEIFLANESKGNLLRNKLITKEEKGQGKGIFIIVSDLELDISTGFPSERMIGSIATEIEAMLLKIERENFKR